ncbi:MAG: hypothetical protein ACRCYS_07455, partial [Beijerinckiaceae bacterium]
MVRLFLYAVSLSAVAWVALVSTHGANQARLSEIERSLRYREPFSPAVLERLGGSVQPAGGIMACDVAALRVGAWLSAVAADQSLRSGHYQPFERHLDRTAAMSQALLGCAPTDGLGWLLRFFGIQQKEGVGAKALESLAFS